jgi:hypothetical protein
MSISPATIWPLAIIGLGIIIAGAFLVVKSSAPARNAPTEARAVSLLLARDTLHTRSVVNLLLSSSFGVNALLYAAWLGFSIGMWALLIQVAWSVSFLLLGRYSSSVRSLNSLHELLGERFGKSTKILAAICTLAGFTYLIGWELAIGKTSTLSLLNLTHALSVERAQTATTVFMILVVFGALVYTLWAGMKGQAKVDQGLNAIKLLVVTLITVLLIRRLAHFEHVQFMAALFPSWSTVKQNLGLLGLTTNIIFNVAWQFVDNSSWQSVIAGTDSNNEHSTYNLRMSGLVIFVTIGFIGTLFGISLANISTVDPNNILTEAVGLLPQYQNIMILAMLFLIATCMMSLLDGLFLSSTFTLGLDLIPSSQRSEPTGGMSPKTLPIVRLLLVIIAIAATWGVNFIFEKMGANLFDFVYVVILTQLSLFGPVIIALTRKQKLCSPMWLAIAISLVAGFGSVVIGTRFHRQVLIDGAGAFTLITSTGLAFLITHVVGGRYEHTKNAVGAIN